MKTKLLITAVVALFAMTLQAQTLGEFKPKDQSYGLGKLKGANKIYIAGFEVHFQVYNEKEKFKQGGYQLGGGQKGDAQAEISIGLDGLDEKTVQELTNQLYNDYLAKLKAKGLTIVSADEAAKTEAYEDYQKVSGGKVSLAEIPGVMTCSPAGFEYMIKGVDKSGKQKKGGFLGNEASKYAKLSKDLGDAIIGNVDITVLFVADKGAFQGSGAKLKVATSLRIVGQEAIMMTNDKAIFKGQNTITHVDSNIEFYHGKVGAGSTSVYIGTLGKNLSIQGVIDDSTVTSYAAGSIDGGTATMYGRYYSPKSETTKNAKIIPVDAPKYSKGVYAGAKKFLDYHVDEFLKSF